MSDSENISAPPPPDQDSTADAQQEERGKEPTAEVSNPGKASNHMAFSIWPPAQRTRDAVVNRLIETLSTPSVLSNRYGTMPKQEAQDAASAIEEEAFATAGGSAAADDDGIQILQVYSKEISKRMLEAVKGRNTASAAAAQPDSANVESVTSEDATQPDTESS